ncbi:MAG: ATP-binding protein [Alphaproteobacteria bacterium]
MKGDVYRRLTQKRVRPYAASLLPLIFVWIAGALSDEWLTYTDVVVVGILPVLWAAVRHGRGPSVFLAVVGAVGVNYFFFPPKMAFGFQTTHDLVTLATYLATAITTASLASRLREEANLHRQRETEATALHAIGQRLAKARGIDEIISAACEALQPLTGSGVHLLKSTDGNWVALPGERPITLGPLDQFAASAAMASEAPSHGEAPWERGSRHLFLPIRKLAGGAGVVAIEGTEWSPDQLHLLSTAVDVITISLENAYSREEIANARVRLQADQFRSALLNSVSHDFRTPLGTILGAASSLLDAPECRNTEGVTIQLTAIRDAARRLDRYTHNLLGLTRLESGALTVSREWTDVIDLVGEVVQTFETTSDRSISIHITDDVPLIHVDPVLIEHVLSNLVDNAIKFSERDSRISVSARMNDHGVTIDVFNEGAIEDSLDEDSLNRLFETFYRGPDGRTKRRGSGLGLAICRGFMEAHGGTVTVHRAPEHGGNIFRLTFPAETAYPGNALALEEEN